MEKQNRLEHLRDADARPAKRFVIRCSNCSEGGHNMLTCLKPCGSCDFTPFRAHLVLKDGKKVPTCRLDSTTSVASYPGSRGEGEERAWYTPFAHALNQPSLDHVYWSGRGQNDV